jgi:hypothetical protein
MGNVKIVGKLEYLTMRRKEIERALKELDEWLIANVSNPEFLKKAQKRMSLIVDHEQVTEMISNVRFYRPMHGNSDGLHSIGNYKPI